MADLADLGRRWRAAIGPSDRAQTVGEDLLRRWTEPHRRYHTADHLSAVLTHLDWLGTPSPAVQLAAFFHDAVYQPGQPGNEDDSAELARSELAALDRDPATVGEVVRLVLLTSSHRADPTDGAGSLLCDADLAVLGGTWHDYERYRQAVREEYGFLAEAEWRSGRTDVIGRLIGRPYIFSTGAARAAWEEAARRNLAQELSELGSG